MRRTKRKMQVAMEKEEFKGQALITFSYDDGRRNNYDIALPLHEQFEIPATFAIIAGRVTSAEWTSRHMTAYEVADAARRGVEIASHSMTHEKKFTEMTTDELDLEIVESQSLLDKLTPRTEEVKALCLPFSKTYSRVNEIAGGHYRYIRTDGKRLNDPSSPDRLVYSYPIQNTTTIDQIQKWIDGAVQNKKWIVLMFHGTVDSDNPGRYDTKASTLREVMEYVTSFSRDKLLPANFGEVSRFHDQVRRERLMANISSERPDEQVVAEADGYLITYHRNTTPTGKLAISFGGLPSGKTRTGFGSKFILEQGWDHIFVAQSPMSQYQDLSLEQFQEVVSPLAEGSEVFGYGSSLGAYAALYYGGSIDARIIAAAPKNSAHPLVLQRRFAHLAFNHREMVDVPHSKYPPVILYDPHRRDETRFIERLVLPAYPGAELIKLPFAGHTVLDTMKQAGKLKPFITNYVNYGILDSPILSEDGIPVFAAERGRLLLANSELDGALESFEESLAIKYNFEAAAGKIKALTKLQRFDVASKAVEEYEYRQGSLRGIPQWTRDALDLS